MAKSTDQWQHFRGRKLRLMSLRCVSQCVLIASLYACAACGGTGLAWVGEVHLESASQQSVNVVHASTGSVATSPIPATAEQSQSRPRLNHTVTLGEIDVAATQRDTSGAGPTGSTVVVNNYNQVNVVTPALGYGSYRYSRGSAAFSPGFVTPYRPAPSVPSPLPGQNWPAVADHGPSFPYQASPAVPWTRTQ